MQRIVNPQQTHLFDPFDSVLTSRTRKRLLCGWPGVFRHVTLELMPVDAISEHFDPVMGRPTKELYSIAGLLLIQEFMDWTKDEALDAYSFNMNVHYALNLEPVTHDISKRTLERYIRLFEENDVAKATMDTITVKLVEVPGIRIDKQRLDSTHIFSDMASFGRTRLMSVAIKRFLTQVIRHNKQDYHMLDDQFHQRYAPAVNRLFADMKTDSDSRRLLHRQVAEDMHYLIQRFGDMDAYTRKDTYKSLARIFYEQCEVHEDKVCVKDKTRGNVMQNQNGHARIGLRPMPIPQAMPCEEGGLAGRRRETATEVFRERYRIRSGIEGTNSGLKRRTGLGQLQVRGRPAVFHAIYLKIAGWNILRASVCDKMREIVYARANMAAFRLNFAFLRWPKRLGRIHISLKMQIRLYLQKIENTPKIVKAA